MKKVLSIVLTLALVFGMFSTIDMTKAEAATDEWNAERYGDVIDIGTYLRHLESDEEYRTDLDASIKALAKKTDFKVKVIKNPKAVKDTDVAETTSEADSNFTYNGGTKQFLGYDNGSYYFKNYTLRALGENVEVWVANDLSFPDERPAHVVTQEQVDILRDEFDNNIYQIDTEFFGTPDSHTGENAQLSAWGYVPENYYAPIDGKERVIMLVDNIRDEAYYDASYPFFIAGFYSSTYEGYFDRNIINIDTHSWETRLESTFFGTTAHEFQHLIHDDNDSMEETWINEGMSDFAEYLCGYGHPWGHVNFFLDHPENSLVDWDEHYNAETGPETLADYGQAYLMQLYLNDHYGKDFIQMLAKDEDHGFASVNKVLYEFGAEIDFEELFRRFTIAVAIDNPQTEDGIYNFDSIDIRVNYESAALFEKDGVPAWGGNYKAIDDSMKIQTIKFDGIDFLPSPWEVVDDPFQSEEKVFWGNEGHEKSNQIIFNANLSDLDKATLKFDNFIDIEEQWDFGIVQVSIDNGESWTSLSNGNTRSDIVPEGYPAIKENLPGFTGYYGDWVKEEFDLTPYVGNEVLINFNYMTDWGTNDSGWFIDNIEISEIGYYNDCSSMDGFYSIDEITETYVEYEVSFINEKSLGVGTNEQFYEVLNIDPFNITEAEVITLKKFFSGGNNIMVIWYPAPAGTKGTVDYSYEIVLKSDYAKDK